MDKERLEKIKKLKTDGKKAKPFKTLSTKEKTSFWKPWRKCLGLLNNRHELRSN